MPEQLSILNPEPRRIEGPSLLHQLVPNETDDARVAIEYLSTSDTTERVTYQQLHGRANHLARRLRDARKRLDSPTNALFVAPIFIPQCPHLYVSQLAALKAGAAFCPIAIDVPAERLRFILRDVGAHILLTTVQLKARLPDLDNVQVITVDDDDQNVDGTDCSSDIDPAQPAYIMYTSGSTGQPKGVVISHASATQALLAHDRYIPPFNRFLQFANPTFDVCVFESYFPLLRGCTIVTGERRLMLNDLPHFITRMEIDAAELTPSVASSLLQGRKSVPTLKVLLTIGEMLKQDVVENFGGSGSQEGVLHGMYGPTEATIHCTLQTSFSKDTPVGNIGVPLDTVSAFVVSAAPSSDSEPGRLDILPIGEEGELAVGGYQLADGYLNRPKETEAAFCRHPRYGMLYRTGDRARLTNAGTLECLGRISHGQVKLRGQRIELGEIEYAALKTDGVISVVADVIENSLIIFCISKTEILEADVQKTCSQWLPAFMVPKDVVFLDRLPYLDSGKVDRKALKAFSAERKRPAVQPSRDLSTRGHRIIEIIRAVLGAQVDANTPLASAGMDSLSAIRITSQLRKDGFPQLDATALLDARSISEIEGLFNSLEKSHNTKDLPNGKSNATRRLRDVASRHPAISQQLDEIEGLHALTPVQLAMLAETAKDGQAYCNSIEFNAADENIDRVHTALIELAKHHALLRGGFVLTDVIDTNYALVIWKNLRSDQIRQTDSFGQNFWIARDEDLLRPCKFQLIQTDDQVRILLHIHHSLYDQWSLDVLRADLSTLLLGRDLPTPPAFQEVSSYQQANRSGTLSEASEEFWQNMLRNFSMTPLPLMNGKRVKKGLLRTPWQDLEIDSSRLKAEARSLGVGIHVVFQAAMTYLLGCYIGTTDVTYGMVFSGRNLPIAEIESIFGPCLTTLPLRVDFSTTRTRLDLLRSIQQRNRDLQKKALTPLAEISQSGDVPPGTRLFDTLFVWQETSLDPQVETGKVTEIKSADHHEFDLVLEFQPSGGGLQAKATYQQASMTLDQIELLLRQATTIVHEILQKPDGLVKDLALDLPEKLLSVSNFPTSSCAAECDLLGAIRGYATEIPHAAAISFASSITGGEANVENLTYSDLDARSNRMANFLRSHDVLPDDLVCICMDKSIDMYVSILATFKAGAGYLPLIPETPPSRIRSIFNQSRVKLCCTDGSTTPTFQNLGIDDVVNVTDLDLASYGAEAIECTANGTHIAYVVFTSGSTGEPKGVTVTKDNLFGNLETLKQLYDAKPGDRLLQACSQAFDVSAFEILFSFYTGMCLCSAKPADLFYDLEAVVRAFGITHLSLTPTVAALVDPKNVPTVRFLVTAGEGVTDLVHRLWAGNGLHQGYGPSETTNICTINMDASPDDVINNIGPPFRNTSAFVISPDSRFEVLPAGSFGEFAFGGEQVFRGYVNANALNSKQIVDHPRYGRVYKSGDLGRILHDGTLLIGGRIDGQVKVRGNRVELGEISSVLLNDDSIHDSTTILVGQGATEQSLASFIVPKQADSKASERAEVILFQAVQVAQLFERLSDSIPHYMMPDIIVPVSRLPLTAQGKLDKRHLYSLFKGLSNEARQNLSRGGDSSTDLAAWSEGECQIADALRESLRLPNTYIGRNQSFFSVGLNSLNAMPFAKLASSRLKTRVQVPTVLQNSTIARLAKELDSKSSRATERPDAAALDLLPPTLVEEVQSSNSSLEGGVECVLPCTPLQTAMLSSSLSKTCFAYDNSLALHIPGDIDRLKQCWEHMVARHAILRTRFVETSDREHPFVQVIVKDLPLPWTETNGDGRRIVDAIHPFAIQAQNSLGGYKLILHMQHAIYDGISMSQLLEEVETIYRGDRLPPPPSFVPFLAEVQSQAGDDAIEYWRSIIEGYVPKPFPTLHSPISQDELQIEKVITVSRADVDSFCKRHALSPLAVFQAALAKLLLRCQQAQDLSFGNVVSGRTVAVEGVGTLVAPCLNTVPVRVNLADARTNSELVQQLSKSNKSMLPYQLTPLRRIQMLSRSPSAKLYDCLFIFQPPSRELDPDIWTVEDDTGAMGLPLVFEITPKGDSYTLLLHVSQTYISSKSAWKLSAAYDSALLSCIKYPESSCDAFENFESAEIDGILAGEDGTEEQKAASESTSDEPWTADEAAVRTAFASLAKVREENVKKNTVMYQLGLDSLNAPQIAHRLRSMGYEVDAANVMESPTPSLLAVTMKGNSTSGSRIPFTIDLKAFDKQWRNTVVSSLGWGDAVIEAVRPCTAVQGGMLSQSFNSDGKLYINHVTYKIPESISVTALRKAWRAVQTRHQMLRAGFHRLEESSSSPFVIVIQREHAALLPMEEISDEVSVNEIEEKASAAMMESNLNRPWQITVQIRSKGQDMTLSLSHALYDAESLHVILSDLSTALYTSKLSSSVSIDPILSTLLAAEADQDRQGEDFWKTTLEHADFSKFPDITPTVVKGHLQSRDLTCSLSVSFLEQVCRNKGITIQALGEATWARLLAAYTGEENVTFGIVLSSRSISIDEDVIFPSISTIPVPCNTAGSDAEILQYMLDFNGAVQKYRFTPLTDIQRFANRSNKPLFDTVFVYQKASTQRDDSEWQILHETAAVEYAVSLELEAISDGRIQMRLTFDTSRVPPEHASLILQQYDNVLSLIATGNVRTPSPTDPTWSMLPAREPSLPTNHQLLHHRVEAGAFKHPDRPALHFVSGSELNSASMDTWTFKQLNDISNQVAHLIQDMGVESNSNIAVCMDKCPEASFAFVGILKAGCSFLAVDPALPENRLTFILEDSKAQILFGDKPDCPVALPSDTKYVHLSIGSFENLPTSLVSGIVPSASSTCYCLYTSGTTGTPKGCEITHENAVQAMMAFERLFAGRWDEQSRWLQFASYWFDVSVLEHMWSWGVGIAVVGASRDLVLEDIPGFIREFGITHIDLTPSLARLVHPDDVPSLWNGVFITGGEALKQEIIDAWGPKSTICNGYGPTEATIGVTMNTFINSDAKPANIGRQFDNVGSYVLHPGSDEVVMRGAVGELCISGKLVGKGYLNRPDLTAELFPTLGRYNERVYRTGDLVRMLADGSFSFIGRKDTQTKLRGQRLEIAEIDTIIEQSTEEITDVLSTVVKSGEGGKEALVSFIAVGASKKGQELQRDTSVGSRARVQAAKDACIRALPAYMIPTHVIPVNYLPLTVNNKLDTKKLVELFTSLSMKELQSLQHDGQSTGPLNEIEKRIRKVLGETLSVESEDFPKSANLFSLGLSSISAISFAVRLKQAGFSNASPATVMRNPTLGLLGQALSSASSSAQDDESVRQAELSAAAFTHRHLHSAAQSLGVPVDAIEAVIPCTSLQQGMIIDSMRGDSVAYFNDFCYDISRVDISTLRSSWQTLGAGLQILRTQFINSNEGHVQVILREPQIKLTEIKKAVKSFDKFVGDAKQRWIDQNASELTSALEIHIVRTESRQYMVVLMHHATYDGISYELILELLTRVYKSQRPYDFGPNFTTAVAHGLLHSVKGAQEFWTARLNYSSHTALDVVSDDTDVSTHMLNFCLGDVESIEPVRKGLGISHQALLQSCFELALCVNRPSIQIYGLVVSGRSIPLERADRVVGPMFNTLPYSINIQPGSTINEHMRALHQTNVEAIPYQHTPLREIRKWCGQYPAESMFDVLFIFQHKEGSNLSEAEQLFQLMDTTTRADYPLECEIELTDDGILNATILAQSNYFNREDLNDLRENLEQVLSSVRARQDTQIESIVGVSISESRGKSPRPNGEFPHLNGVYGFEWSQRAEKLRKMLAELTGVGENDIDEHSSIFALGLDSIDAVKLASRMRNAGMPIPVGKVLQAQTIPRILQAAATVDDPENPNDRIRTLKDAEKSLIQAQLPGLLHDADVERMLPTTPSQEALLAEMIRTDFQEYFNHDVLRLKPSTNLRKLQNAWQSVVDNTPILRTSFVEVEDPELDFVFAQVIHTKMTLHFDEYVIDHIEDLDAILDAIRRKVSTNFQNIQPLRLSIVNSPSETYLILSLSHAQYDGFSLAMVHDDLHGAYGGKTISRPMYDNAIEEALSAPQESHSYWTGLIAGARPCAFPLRSRAEITSKTHRTETTATVSAGDGRAFCQSQGISMQALAETCWSITLAQYTKSFDVRFGVVLACRDSEEAEQVVFPLMNTVPMRSSLHGSRAEMLRYMQDTITERSLHQRTPLRSIQSAVQKIAQGNDEVTGLFDTLFIYQRRPVVVEDVPRLYESVRGSSNVEYPVAIEMEAVGEHLVLRTACKDNALDEAGAAKLLQTFDQVLLAITTSPEKPTVDFKRNRVSICDLQSFNLPSPEADKMHASSRKKTPDDVDDSVDSATTSMIIDALAEVSKAAPGAITPTSTIESIGIDSISAIKVASILRKQSINLTVSEIVRAKTPARMASAVASKVEAVEKGGESASEVIAASIVKIKFDDIAAKLGIDADNIEKVLPATAGQTYMLSMWLKTTGHLFYPTFEYALTTKLGVEQIEQAWGVLVDRHSILRTAFYATGEVDTPLLQIVLKDASANPSNSSMASLEVQTNSSGCLLKLTIQHALYDAVSLSLLMQDFQSLLERSARSRPKGRFEDFLALSLSLEAAKTQKAFWTRYLQSAKPMQLHPPKTNTYRKRVEIFEPTLFDSTAELDRQARTQSVSVQAFLFAAYAKVYASLARPKSGDKNSYSDVVLGIYLSNRSHMANLETLAEPTLNLVPLLVRTVHKTSVLDLARQIHADLRETSSAENSAVGLWKVKEWTGVVIDTFVNFLKLPEQDSHKVQNGSSTALHSLNERLTGARKEAMDVSEAEFEVPNALKGLTVVDAFQLSVDIEMTVQNGKLGVGFFCPEEMVSLNGAGEALQHFKSILEQIAGELSE